MKTDRELLELAAKAAGIQGFSGEDWNGVYFCTPANPDVPRSEPIIYKWLTDDGDALRLAVKLRIDLEWQGTQCIPTATVEAYQSQEDGSSFCASENECDYRRAIVRAAAAIGEQMP